MLHKWTIFFATFLSLSIWQCDKIDVPDPVSEDPAFELIMAIGGDSLNLIAGESNYFMFSSYTVDTNDIHTFIGTLAEENCNANCGESLRFELRDFQAVTLGTPVDISNAVQTIAYDFRNYVQDTSFAYSLNLQATPTPPPMPVFGYTYNWQLPGMNSNLAQFETDVSESDIDDYNVCLSITGQTMTGDCNSTFCRKIDWDNPNTVNCNIEVLASPQQATLEAKASGGNLPYTYMWDDSSSSAFRPILQDSITATYCVTVTDVEGDESSMCKSVFYESSGASGIVGDTCSALFTFDAITDLVTSEDPFQFSTIAIEYTAANGKVYRSDVEEQPVFSSFTILEITPFDRNENNQAALQLKIRFDATLFEVGGSGEIQISGGAGTIAIAYPD